VLGIDKQIEVLKHRKKKSQGRKMRFVDQEQAISVAEFEELLFDIKVENEANFLHHSEFLFFFLLR